MTGIGIAAAKVGMDFEAEIFNLSAITGMSADEMKQVEAGIREIALQSGKSVMEIASNTKMLAEAGGDVNLMMEQLAHGTNLATATQTNMATTLDFLGSTMKTFGIEAEDTQSVVDSFALVTSLANVELSQLGESYVNAGGSAASAGLSINDVNAMLVTFSNAGLKGGAAGTSLNAVLRNLATPTDKAAGALNDLGVALYDSEGASRNMFDIMGDLESALSDLSDEQRSRYESVVFDTVAQKGWNMIAADGIDSIIELSGELSGSSDAFDGLGQAAGMAGIQTDNLKGKLNLLGAQLIDLGIQLYEKFETPIKKAVESVSGALAFLAENMDTILAIIVPLGVSFGVFAIAINIGSMIKKVSDAMLAFNAVLAANPIGIVIALIAGLVAGIIYLWNTNEDFKNALIGAWEAIKKFFTEDIPNAFNAVIDFVKDNWQGLLLLIINPFAGALKLLYDLSPQFKEWVDSVVNSIKEKFDEMVNIGKSIVEGLWSGISKKVEWLYDKVTGFFQNVIDKVKEIFGIRSPSTVFAEIGTEIINGFISTLKELPEAAWNAIKGAIDKVKTWGEEIIRAGREKITSFVSTSITIAQEIPQKLENAIREGINIVQNWGQNVTSKAREGIENMRSAIVSAASNIPNEMYNIGSNIVNGVWNGIQSASSWFRSSVTGFFSGIVDNVKGTLGISSPSRVFAEIGMNLGEGFVQGVESMHSAIESTMEDTFGDLSRDVSVGFNEGGASITPLGQTAQNTLGGTVFNITINADINSELDIEYLAQQLARRADSAMRGRGFSYGS